MDKGSFNYLLKKVDCQLFELISHLICSICRELFDKPVSTPCGHVFCNGCIKRVLSSRDNSGCPLCKNSVKRYSLKADNVMSTLSSICQELPSAFEEDVRDLSNGFNGPVEDLVKTSKLVQLSNHIYVKERKKSKRNSSLKNVVKVINTCKTIGKDENDSESFLPVLKRSKNVVEYVSAKRKKKDDLISVSQAEAMSSNSSVYESSEIDNKFKKIEKLPTEQKVKEWINAIGNNIFINSPNSSPLHMLQSENDSISDYEKSNKIPSMDYNKPEKYFGFKRDEEKSSALSTTDDPYEFVPSQNNLSKRKKQKKFMKRGKISDFQAIKSFSKEYIKRKGFTLNERHKEGTLRETDHEISREKYLIKNSMTASQKFDKLLSETKENEYKGLGKTHTLYNCSQTSSIQFLDCSYVSESGNETKKVSGLSLKNENKKHSLLQNNNNVTEESFELFKDCIGSDELKTEKKKNCSSKRKETFDYYKSDCKKKKLVLGITYSKNYENSSENVFFSNSMDTDDNKNHKAHIKPKGKITNTRVIELLEELANDNVIYDNGTRQNPVKLPTYMFYECECQIKKNFLEENEKRKSILSTVHQGESECFRDSSNVHDQHKCKMEELKLTAHGDVEDVNPASVLVGFSPEEEVSEEKKFKEMVEKLEKELKSTESVLKYNSLKRRYILLNNKDKTVLPSDLNKFGEIFSSESLKDISNNNKEPDLSNEPFENGETIKNFVSFNMLGEINHFKTSFVEFIRLGRLTPIVKRSKSSVVKLVFPIGLSSCARKRALQKKFAVGVQTTQALPFSLKNNQSNVKVSPNQSSLKITADQTSDANDFSTTSNHVLTGIKLNQQIKFLTTPKVTSCVEIQTSQKQNCSVEIQTSQTSIALNSAGIQTSQITHASAEVQTSQIPKEQDSRDNQSCKSEKATDFSILDKPLTQIFVQSKRNSLVGDAVSDIESSLPEKEERRHPDEQDISDSQHLTKSFFKLQNGERLKKFCNEIENHTNLPTKLFFQSSEEPTKFCIQKKISDETYFKAENELEKMRNGSNPENQEDIVDLKNEEKNECNQMLADKQQSGKLVDEKLNCNENVSFRDSAILGIIKDKYEIRQRNSLNVKKVSLDGEAELIDIESSKSEEQSNDTQDSEELMLRVLKNIDADLIKTKETRTVNEKNLIDDENLTNESKIEKAEESDSDFFVEQTPPKPLFSTAGDHQSGTSSLPRNGICNTNILIEKNGKREKRRKESDENSEGTDIIGDSVPKDLRGSDSFLLLSPPQKMLLTPKRSQKNPDKFEGTIFKDLKINAEEKKQGILEFPSLKSFGNIEMSKDFSKIKKNVNDENQPNAENKSGNRGVETLRWNLTVVEERKNNEKSISSKFKHQNKRLCVVASSVKNPEMIKKFVSRFKIEYFNKPTKSMTHLIVGLHESDDGKALPLCTPKLLYAMANNKWIVSEHWAENCLKLNTIIPEESFETLDPIGRNGCRMARLSNESLLKNCQIYLLGDFQTTSKEEFADLILDCGGTLVSKPESFNFSSSKTRMIIADRDCLSMDEKRLQELHEKYETVILSRDVVIMSILSYKLANFTPYLLHLASEEDLVRMGYPPYLVKNDEEGNNNSSRQ